jgi:nitrate reductase NapE component
MPDNELKPLNAAENYQGRPKAKERELTLFEAVTMSVVAILAVAVGTIYGTILF